ncbi:MAG: Fumarate reductase cytochrome b subunit [uncultured Sulfurovum sp.]|uniref:Fumarate reductase cytochrome b subunit n=1 Tax=uncultured Sulfurovum sp. TaxID=269237 RepID=A0A6S6TSA0_9BACT|nr:MAG: Fumarate reductase cytochrome b subunit [uncultured Sulfurovum sp.]
MRKNNNITTKKSRVPARLDYFQSGSGLILGIFMWGHMLMVSSILISKDFMYSVTKFFEGSFLFEGGAPILVSGFAFFIFVVFIVHAFLGMRKLPANYKQYKIIKETSSTLNHEDTKLWFIQAFTGFSMFFLGSIHIFIIMTNPDQIGPYASADRVWSGWMWPLFILLLLAVEFHGTIGLYRLCVKWGWFDGDDPRKTRKTLKKVKNYLTAFFLILGFTTLGAYMKIGYDHRHNVGERYVPSTAMVYETAKVERA